jgi:hypothetical protein
MTQRFCSILALSAVLVSLTAPAHALPQVELRGANSELTRIGIEPRLPQNRFLASDAGVRAPLPTPVPPEIEEARISPFDAMPPRAKGARIHLDLYTERAQQTGKLEDVALTANYTISW